MRTSRLVIVGAVLPLLLGASLGSLTTSSGSGTWAYPMSPGAFLALSLGLAVSHLLVLTGYAEIARRASAPVSRLAVVGGAGTALVALCEVWSGLVARTDLDAPVIAALEAGYLIASVAIVVGTVGAGAALRRSGSALALPLLVNGAALLLATAVKAIAGDGWGVAALTVWSLLYVWVALRLDRSGYATMPERDEPARTPSDR